MLHKVGMSVNYRVGKVFSPEEAQRLKLTFERFWEAISVRFLDADTERTRQIRERLARLILRIAHESRRADGFDQTLPALKDLDQLRADARVRETSAIAQLAANDARDCELSEESQGPASDRIDV